MENIKSMQFTEETVNEYLQHACITKLEHKALQEILVDIKANNQERLTWFCSFGHTIRHILMNHEAYLKGLEFGFTDIAFDQYGWFKQPVFFDKEAIKLGITNDYLSHSELRIGRGANGHWTQSLSYSFGCAGGGSNISVYGKHYDSRRAAINEGLSDLKKMMQGFVGNTDITNYKQHVIAATLKAIDDYKFKEVQMTLF